MQTIIDGIPCFVCGINIPNYISGGGQDLCSDACEEECYAWLFNKYPPADPDYNVSIVDVFRGDCRFCCRPITDDFFGEFCSQRCTDEDGLYNAEIAAYKEFEPDWMLEEED